ncbi:cytochrome b [Saccharibacter sp. 17.LH.SD]|uniref:cytochrome b n=1 Tax=Saccharibacter sp. 17.LH.SD TaxID=2689393 RepID=UPI0013712388|nr:cytochrome b N-terminal domain-containing protein [Saccharibacter sp. 17.LH.SD]MXV44955.1 cytochrome b [Saccharibacter sp. 17.LH.SD]
MTPPPSPFSHWLNKRLPFLRPLHQHFSRFPMPPVNGWWTLGACLIAIVLLMGASGLFLALNYTPDIQQAFSSIETIERRVPSGWLIRSLHMGGATVFFAALYLHIGRGLWYGSYKAPRELVWLSGLLLMVLFMTTAFAGYVLPWGQMSYWGATVITHAIEAIPALGKPLVTFLLGGNDLGTVALHRLFVLHFTLGFIVLAIIGLHVLCLHGVGSSNPTADSPTPITTTRPFHSDYSIKDGLAVCGVLIIYAILIFFLPDWLEKTSNLIPADPLKTPSDITPEWYLAPFYAMLRAVPSRLGGLIIAATSIIILFALPWLDQSPRHNATYRPTIRVGMTLAFMAFLTLGIAGLHTPSTIWLWLSRLSLIVWFSVFLLILPLTARHERLSPKGDHS